MNIKYKLCCVFTLSVFIAIFATSCRKEPKKSFPDYAMFTVVVSTSQGNEISSIGYACVYAEKEDVLLLQTAKHLVENKNNKYFITFKSGLSADITAIDFPDKNKDIAIIQVKRKLLKNGKDYFVPESPKEADYKAGLGIYIWRDEYDNNPVRKIDDVNYQVPITIFSTAGSIAPGRSGSPVFLKDSKICLGVVSGYFKADSAMGEKTICLSYINNEKKL